MTRPKTLIELAGATPPAAGLADSVVVVIDAQREYEDGQLALPGIHPAIAEISALIARARRHGRPVLHVVHRGRQGGLFDPAVGGRVIEALKPHDGETVIEKTLPNGFAGTGLERAVKDAGAEHMVICGFMTHMCVSSTAHAALERGLAATVVANATATRALPSPVGAEPVPWERVQEAALAALADRFARVVAAEGEVPN